MPFPPQNLDGLCCQVPEYSGILAAKLNAEVPERGNRVPLPTRLERLEEKYLKGFSLRFYLSPGNTCFTPEAGISLLGESCVAIEGKGAYLQPVISISAQQGHPQRCLVPALLEKMTGVVRSHYEIGDVRHSTTYNKQVLGWLSLEEKEAV